jgi:small redox-active disulfide protein 2
VFLGAKLYCSSTPLLHFFERRNIMEIKVLGPGCPRCQQTEKNVKEALSESGVSADVVKVTDTMEIAKHGVFGTPAVVVDGEVKSVGKIPTKDEIKGWITKE